MTKFTFDTWNRTAQITYSDNPNGEAVPYFYDFGGLPERVHGTEPPASRSPTPTSSTG